MQGLREQPYRQNTAKDDRHRRRQERHPYTSEYQVRRLAEHYIARLQAIYQQHIEHWSGRAAALHTQRQRGIMAAAFAALFAASEQATRKWLPLPKLFGPPSAHSIS